MEQLKTVSLEAFHDKVKQVIDQHWRETPGQIKVVDEYTLDTINIKSPTVIVGVDQMWISDSPETARTCLEVDFNIYPILCEQHTRSYVAIRSFAAEIMRLVEYQARKKWGFGTAVKTTDRINAQPFTFKEGYQAYGVSFTVEIFIADKEYPIPHFIPDTLFAGRAPKIGLKHKDDYRKILDPTEPLRGGHE